jgi:pseudaminic acid biosynthesis N-acetyl transferase
MVATSTNELNIGCLSGNFDLGDGILLQNFVHLSEEDQLMVLEWRNHPNIRQWMFQQEEISRKEHLRFIQNLEGQQNRFYWILLVNGQKIGVINLCHFSTRSSEWGFYLKPELLGNGQSVILIYSALKFFFDHLAIDRLYGLVLQENLNALLLHDLFYIQYQAGIPYTILGKTLMCECRSISRQNWMQQSARLGDIKRRLVNQNDYYHQLKTATLERLNLS